MDRAEQGMKPELDLAPSCRAPCKAGKACGLHLVDTSETSGRSIFAHRSDIKSATLLKKAQAHSWSWETWRTGRKAAL